MVEQASFPEAEPGARASPWIRSSRVGLASREHAQGSHQSVRCFHMEMEAATRRFRAVSVHCGFSVNYFSFQALDRAREKARRENAYCEPAERSPATENGAPFGAIWLFRRVFHPDRAETTPGVKKRAETPSISRPAQNRGCLSGNRARRHRHHWRLRRET